MQTFIVKNGIGTKLDMAGINEKTLVKAKKFFNADTDDISLVSDLNRPGNAFWFRSEDTDRALDLVSGENIGPVVSARKIKDNKAIRTAENLAAHNEWALKNAGNAARRVRHAKFGEGTVTIEGEKAVTVLFDSQKKELRIVPNTLETI